MQYMIYFVQNHTSKFVVAAIQLRNRTLRWVQISTNIYTNASRNYRRTNLSTWIKSCLKCCALTYCVNISHSTWFTVLITPHNRDLTHLYGRNYPAKPFTRPFPAIYRIQCCWRRERIFSTASPSLISNDKCVRFVARLAFKVSLIAV